MLGAIKVWAWSVLIIGTGLILTPALATPILPDEQADLFVRASASANHTGAYVGSPCYHDSDCYSRFCLGNGDGSVKGVCTRQNPGGPCFRNSNCQYRSCELNTGRCLSTGIGASCVYNADCSDGYDFGSGSELCINSQCRIMDSYPCTSNSQCASGRCFQNTCRAQAQPPNTPCSGDADCISNSCLSYELCTSSNGAFTYCPNSAYIAGTNCARYPLGHACVNPGDCLEGQCKNGQCVNSTLGDACQEEYQCTSPSLCGSNNTCVAAPSRPMYPTEECNVDDPSQCLSGECTFDLRTKDSNGVPDPYTHDGYLSSCTYLPNGVAGCRNSTDCATGICKKSTCVAGADGDRCQLNENCQNLCSLKGRCYTPSKLNHGNEPCKTDDQCISGTCLTNLQTSRPGLDTPNHSPVQVHDSSCEFSLIGHKCEIASDCVHGACISGICSYVAVGGSCTAPSQCTSEFCGLKNGTVPTTSSNSTAHQTCQLGPAGNTCNDNSNCFSGVCIPDPCYGYGGHGSDGETCGPMCAPVSDGGKCRSDVDCNDGVSCVRGYCGAPPKTTTTTSTATNTSTSTSTTVTSSKAAATTTTSSVSKSSSSSSSKAATSSA